MLFYSQKGKRRSIIMENRMSGENVELYDGEDRTGGWWIVVLLGAAIASILFYVFFGIGCWVLQEGNLEDGSQLPIELQKLGGLMESLRSTFGLELKQLVGVGVLFGIGIFIVTIGFSMIFFSFAYCLFHWNIMILLLVGVSVFFVIYMLLDPGNLRLSLYVSFAATFGVIALKTLIFYFGGWRVVSWS